MRPSPDRLRRFLALFLLLPMVALAQTGGWMVTNGQGRFVVERPHRGAETARPETLDAARFRQALENGTRIRCPRGSWLQLQPPGAAAPLVLRGGEIDLVTGPLRPSAREVADRMKTFQRYFTPGGPRRGSTDRSICWPDTSDTVWAAAASLMLTSPIGERSELRARTEPDTRRSLVARIDVDGDVVDADTLRRWLRSVQDPERVVRVTAELRHRQGLFVTTFLLAPARVESQGLARVPRDTSGSPEALLDRSLAWLRGGQYPVAYREAERAAFLLQSLDAYAVADTIRMKMGCR